MADDGDDPSYRELQKMGTASLLARARAGDERARNLLVCRYRARLMRWAHGRLPIRARDGQETEDIVQEALQKAFKTMETFEPRHDGAFLSYAITICLNVIRDRARKAQRRPQSVELDENHQDGAPSLLDVAVGKDEVRRYEKALAALSEDHRTAIRLRFEVGLTYQEIAVEMKRESANAARLLVKRALDHLVRRMNARRRAIPGP